MAAWRRAIELSLGDADVERLRSIAQSRTEPASRVERARILLAYQEDPSFFAVGRALGYPHELWTTRLLARHAREHGPAEGHAYLANLAQGTVCTFARVCGKTAGRRSPTSSRSENPGRGLAGLHSAARMGIWRAARA